jgi:hypothetical protein
MTVFVDTGFYIATIARNHQHAMSAQMAAKEDVDYVTRRW